MTTTEASAIRHGEQRDSRQETWHGPVKEYVNKASGAVIYRGPTVSGSSPACERYCGKCQAWKAQRGILAAIVGCPDCGADWYA